MPDDAAEVQDASVDPAPKTSQEKPAATDDSVTMTKTDLASFVKQQTDDTSGPLQKKLNDTMAELGRLKKSTSLDEDALERYANAESNFKDTKDLVISLGVSEDDIKDAENIRELKLVLQGLKSRAVISEKDGTDATSEAFKEFMKAKSSGGGASEERMVGNAGTPPMIRTNSEALAAFGNYESDDMEAAARAIRAAGVKL